MTATYARRSMFAKPVYELPVGSIFTTILDIDPADLLGYGTWTPFGTGRVLVGVDSGNPAIEDPEDTTGALTVVSSGTVSQPTFTGNALGNHSHSISGTADNASAGTPAGTVAWPGSVPTAANESSHTHTYTQVPNHTHIIAAGQGSHQHGLSEGQTDGAGTFVDRSNAASAAAAVTDLATLPQMVTNNPTGGVATGTTAAGSAHTHTISWPGGVPTFTGSALGSHSHTLTGGADNASAGTPSGTVSQPTFTGDATSVVQPSIAVFFWKRTA